MTLSAAEALRCTRQLAHHMSLSCFRSHLFGRAPLKVTETMQGYLLL